MPDYSTGCQTTRHRWRPERIDTETREALVTLTEHGFIVDSRETDRKALDKFFTDTREDTEQLRVTDSDDAAVQLRV